MTAAALPENLEADRLPQPCPGCGYDLHHLASNRCPECGTEVTLDEVPTSNELPWHDRRRLGRFRALWRQCRLVLGHPTRLAGLVDRSISYSAARRFHVICCLIAWLGLTAPAVYGFILFRRAAIRGGILSLWKMPPAPKPTLADYLFDGSILLAMLTGLFLWLLTATGVPSYFCHPRRQPLARQEAAIALSYYAAAPLLLMPVAILLLAGFYAATQVLFPPQAGRDMATDGKVITLLLGGPMLLVMTIYLWLIPVLLLRRGLAAPWRRVIATSLTLTAAWPGLFVLWVIGLPLLMWWMQSVIFTVART